MQVAWDAPETRRAWRSYRSGALRWLAAAAACIVVGLLAAQFAVSSARSLLTQGAPTEGTVTAADPTSVTFEYDAGGSSFEATLTIVSGRTYEVGQAVEVRYDRDDPMVARLLDEPRRLPYIGPIVIGLFLLAAFALPVGVGGLLRARRWRRALAAAPWDWARLRIDGLAIALTAVAVPPVHGRLLTTSRWRVSALRNLDDNEVRWLASGSDVLIAVDGIDTLYGARRS